MFLKEKIPFFLKETIISLKEFYRLNTVIARTKVFHFTSQDANECWIQMMRVLQQKLEAIEDDSVKEVSEMCL